MMQVSTVTDEARPSISSQRVPRATMPDSSAKMRSWCLARWLAMSQRSSVQYKPRS